MFAKLVLCVAVAAIGAHAACTYTSPTGYSYDLSRLTHAAGAADITYAENGSTFYVNVCGTTTAACQPSTMSVCQQGGNKGYYGCGTLASQLFSGGEDGNSVKVSYSDGTMCGNGVPRSTHITLFCDKSVEGVIDSVLESGCNYTMKMRSKYACAQATTTTCGFTTPDGRFSYDLSPMAGSEISTTDFFVAVCGNTTECASKGSMAVCQLASNQLYFGLGQLSTQQFSSLASNPADGVTITYTDGTPCANGTPRHSELHVKCDLTLSGMGSIDVISEYECGYVLEMRSRHACPTYNW
eukprot:TRINITY_DN1649_c0_g1_i1.p1 TRINITY_DN1649_c0_g1~~TRINITY_DN1649_c0_g1_i1.p1  ORF type:complete len:297 (+),score=82.37 TRINITY_DN1649_c0_g1_i1:255-1145(+)